MPAPKSRPSLPQIHPKTRRAWRTWLTKNHATRTGVWLVFFKQSTGKRQLAYADAVEEALCFGWIDSLLQPIDHERYMQVFTPRKTGSAWSRLNKTRVEKLIEAGLMMPPGLAKIDTAKRDGSWSKLDAVEDLTIPPDLAKAFAKNKRARAKFDASSRSSRKQVLYWINGVKSPELRAGRVALIIELLARGLAPTPLNRAALSEGDASLRRSEGKRPLRRT